MINQKDTGLTPAAPAKTKCPSCEREFSKMGIKSHIWRVHGEGVTFIPRPGASPLRA